MRTVTLALLLPSLLALSCGKSGPAPEPQPGAWTLTEGAVKSDTCQVAGLPSADGPFTLAYDGTRLTIDPLDGSPPFECSYTHGAFDCPARLQGEVDLAQQSGGLLEGRLKVNVSLSGTFGSDTTLSGTEKGQVSCTGSGCDTAASYFHTSFPCAVSKAITAKAN